MLRAYRAHRRGTALFFAAVFSFVGWADASGLHVCPQHDGLPVATTSETGSAHGLADAAPAAAESSHDSHHEGPCTCVGAFDDQGSALQPALPGAVFLDAPISRPARARADSAILTPSLYRLPFANAPPHLI